MADVEPFQLAVEESKLEQLQRKLSSASFPDELDDAAWDYGAPLADVKRLTAYWRDQFDWRKAETKINELPQFRTSIEVDGFEKLNIHFVHQTSKVPQAIPLLFCHGWPGSFLEVSKLLPLLGIDSSGTDTPAFHIVAPSIPNYGFSDGVKKRGFGIVQYAETCHKLMQKLGYNDYVTQGGDWGSMITRAMGILYPKYCKASHINMVRAAKPNWTSHPILALQHLLTPYSARDYQGFARTKWFMEEGSGYAREQGTKPQTLGYALTDSPVALLAWIYEKLHDWSDEYPWSEEEILTWVSVYWFSTAGPAASLRIYYEATHTQGIHRDRTTQYVANVKLGLAIFPKELVVMPVTWARTLGPVVYESLHERGGHFAAHENPHVIAGDLQKMFGKDGGAYGAIKGKDGYGKVMARL